MYAALGFRWLLETWLYSQYNTKENYQKARYMQSDFYYAVQPDSISLYM